MRADVKVDRRDFLSTAGAVASSLAIPLPLVAASASKDTRTQRILLIARQQVERVAAHLMQRDRAGIADYGAHSTELRFHLVDLAAGTVCSYRVAHGAGSDPENDGWLNHFSNRPRSNSTSRGAYVTGNLALTSLPLDGLDPSNSNALARSLTLHPSEGCSVNHIDRQGRLGRSDGSLAVAPSDFLRIAQQLSHGRLVFADRLKLD
jgi:hypothetical protein